MRMSQSIGIPKFPEEMPSQKFKQNRFIFYLPLLSSFSPCLLCRWPLSLIHPSIHPPNCPLSLRNFMFAINNDHQQFVGSTRSSRTVENVKHSWLAPLFNPPPTPPPHCEVISPSGNVSSSAFNLNAFQGGKLLIHTKRTSYGGRRTLSNAWEENFAAKDH